MQHKKVEEKTTELKISISLLSVEVCAASKLVDFRPGAIWACDVTDVTEIWNVTSD